MERKVIDISVHNGDIDFKKVKSHVDGVIIRCGYGSDIKSQDDKKWKQNVEGCIDNGIPFGVYIYSYAKTNEMAISEAEHVIRLVKPYKDKLSYPVYYDLEEDGTQKGAVERARTFAKVLTDAGYVVGMYANQNWWDNYLVGLNEFTKWVAKYGINDGKPHTKPNIKGMARQHKIQHLMYILVNKIGKLEKHIESLVVQVEVQEIVTLFLRSTAIIQIH